ncbi:hypothetical protein [Persicobacter sp. CCB-QB2]|uniref:hypothetical protein n=1 Tax=Persicobacter sp. CCB-QB2 TaxID=1561025 RepID=UPI0012FA1A7A|nr:hypothetical protein [Persicobacter sp. CCB-QB2]
MRSFVTTLLVLLITAIHAPAMNFSAEDVKGDKITVAITDDGKEMVIDLSGKQLKDQHTAIDLNRMDEYAYKTRVVRYFGGMLKQSTYELEKLTVRIAGEEIVGAFDRTNLNKIVHLLVQF